MVRAVFENLALERPKNHFTVGIVDDVSHTSLAWDRAFDLDSPDRVQAVFYGLGADGTVGANKNSIKIIGEETDHSAQGYFVYDSKKSGAMTISHLRFGPGPIRSSYLVKRASFVGVHQFQFLERMDVLDLAAPGAVVLLNAPYAARRGLGAPAARGAADGSREGAAAVRHRRLPRGAGGGHGRAHQHHHAGLLLRHLRRAARARRRSPQIKQAIEKTYGKKGAEVVRRNFAAVDAAPGQPLPRAGADADHQRPRSVRRRSRPRPPTSCSG